MSAGDVLIAGAALLTLAAALLKALDLRSRNARLANLSAGLSLLAFVAVTATLLLFGYYFMVSDFTYYQVWSHSSSDLAEVYKLSGVWAGAEGSFLLWTWLMALVLATEVVLEPRRKYLGRRFHGTFQVALAGIVFAFLLLLIDMELFQKTNPLLLQAYPNGYGLSLVLQTPEMVLHPPVVFAGYAFCVVAFAAAAAHFLSRDRNWFMVAFPWTRLGWIFLTLGIGIGAIWAYYVLGWGGYWGWDPVETSSLLPWLIATAFLHALVRHSRKGEYQVLAPALGMTSFVAVVFATFATRAGSIWSSSVHAFGSSVGASAGTRLTYLLEHDSTVLGIFTLMAAMFALTVYLAYSRYRETGPPEEGQAPKRLSEHISDRNNMFLTISLLVITSAIMLLLLFKNVDVAQGPNYSEFNQKMSVFFVATMVTMTVCLIWKVLSREWAFRVAIGLVVVSVALAIAGAASDSLDGLLAFSLPSYAVAVGASAYKLARSRVVGSIRKTLHNASPHIIHLGTAMVLLSYVVSSTMQAYPPGLDEGEGVVVVVGGEFSVDDYTIRLVSLTERPENGIVGGVSMESSREATVQILRSGDVLRDSVELSNLYGRDSLGDYHVLEVEVYIYKAVTNDLYFNFQWMSNSTAIFQAKVIPLMNTLWIGFGLLVVGLAIRTLAWQQVPIEARPERKPQVAAKKPGREKDYEALVEQELQKFKEKKAR